MSKSHSDWSSGKLSPPLEEQRFRADRFPEAIIESRNQLPDLLNARELTGEGALIGVSDGGFAEKLLRGWKGVRLHCVDSWISSAGTPDMVDRYHAPQWKLDHAHGETRRRLNTLADRARIYRMRPSDAACLFSDASLCFVYLDERQSFEAIWEHLETWARKIKPGGVLCGNNYLDGKFPLGHFQGKSAVDTWTKAHSLEVARSGEPVWASWIISIPARSARRKSAKRGE